MSEHYFEQSQEPDFSNEIPEARVEHAAEETPDFAPLITHADWLHKVQEMEAKDAAVVRALRAQGINPDADLDYQYFRGELSLARAQLRGHTVMQAIGEIESQNL